MEEAHRTPRRGYAPRKMSQRSSALKKRMAMATI